MTTETSTAYDSILDRESRQLPVSRRAIALLAGGSLVHRLRVNVGTDHHSRLATSAQAAPTATATPLPTGQPSNSSVAATDVRPGSPCSAPGTMAVGAGGTTLFCAPSNGGGSQWVPRNPGPGGSGPGGPCGPGGCSGSGGSHPVIPAGAVIDTLPFDLSSVVKISKFRSCNGHDYSGKDTDFQSETLRSMKHYIFTRGGAAIKLLAPFDGQISWIIPEFSASENPGSRMVLKRSDGAGGLWEAVFMHVDPLPGMVVGTSVRAGQQFATSSAPRLNWDFGLQWRGRGTPEADPRKFSGIAFESPLLRLSPTVAAAFAARGITPDTIIVSRATRDATACTVLKVQDNTTYFQAGPDDVVALR